MPLNVVLYQPEIPPNTGNVIRLCANTGAKLHLIEPLGFSLDDTKLKRAGMDYRELADVAVHESLALCLESVPGRVYAMTTKATRRVFDARFHAGDVLLFGPETRGLPESVLSTFAEDAKLRIPMRPESRSLNLANAVSVVLYEAWRQLGFDGAR